MITGGAGGGHYRNLKTYLGTICTFLSMIYRTIKFFFIIITRRGSKTGATSKL